MSLLEVDTKVPRCQGVAVPCPVAAVRGEEEQQVFLGAWDQAGSVDASLQAGLISGQCGTELTGLGATPPASEAPPVCPLCPQKRSFT